MLRRSLLLAPPLAAAALAVATAAPAVASVKSCARSAKVVAGTVAIPGYSIPPTPPGQPIHPVRDESKDKVVHHLRIMPVVVKSRHATIRFQHVTYRVSKGSMVRRTCFGESVSSTVLFPSLEMLNGSAVVKAPAGHPGAIQTSQALVNPFQRAGQTFSVRLTNTTDSNVEQGTTIVKKLSGAGLVNVTPYVGPQQGSCRDVHKARLVSPTKKHRQGLAYYDGHRAR